MFDTNDENMTSSKLAPEKLLEKTFDVLQTNSTNLRGLVLVVYEYV
jgi:hypothetical protein